MDLPIPRVWSTRWCSGTTAYTCLSGTCWWRWPPPTPSRASPRIGSMCRASIPPCMPRPCLWSETSGACARPGRMEHGGGEGAQSERARQRSTSAKVCGDCTFGALASSVQRLCLLPSRRYVRTWPPAGPRAVMVVFGCRHRTAGEDSGADRSLDRGGEADGPQGGRIARHAACRTRSRRTLSFGHADCIKLISHARSPCSLRGRVPAHASPATVCYAMLSCTRTAGPRSKMNVFVRNLEARSFPRCRRATATFLEGVRPLTLNRQGGENIHGQHGVLENARHRAQGL